MFLLIARRAVMHRSLTVPVGGVFYRLVTLGSEVQQYTFLDTYSVDPM